MSARLAPPADAAPPAAGVPPHAPAATLFLCIAGCVECGNHFIPRHAGQVQCLPCERIADIERRVAAIERDNGDQVRG